jgi:hypothetical protein
MGRFAIEGTARNVPLALLYDWYTDFRPDDPSLVEDTLRGRPLRFVERKVTRQGIHVLIENMMDYKGRRVLARTETTLRPERFAYDVDTRYTGAMRFRDRRHYAFTELPEGTQIRAECEISEARGILGLLSALGLVASAVRKESQRLMDAYLRVAERELGGVL